MADYFVVKVNFNPKVNRSLIAKLGPKAWLNTLCCLNWDPANSECKPLTHQASLSPTLNSFQFNSALHQFKTSFVADADGQKIFYLQLLSFGKTWSTYLRSTFYEQLHIKINYLYQIRVKPHVLYTAIVLLFTNMVGMWMPLP